MAKKGTKSAPSTSAKGQNGKAAGSTPKQARAAPAGPGGPQVMSDSEEEIITAVLMALCFAAVFVAADNILHAKFDRTMDVQQILTRGALCWIPLIPIAWATTKYVRNWMFRAGLFAATSALAHQLLQLAHSGNTESQLKYGAYYAVYWGWCFFKMPFPDALLSMATVGGYAYRNEQLTLPPHVEAKLRFLKAEFETRSGYKLPF